MNSVDLQVLASNLPIAVRDNITELFSRGNVPNGFTIARTKVAYLKSYAGRYKWSVSILHYILMKR
jgi:hypothetical protein